MPKSFELITTSTLGSTAATILLTSIPQTYTDLLVTTSLRTNEGANFSSVYTTFNTGGSGSVFTERWLYGDGGGAYSGSYSSLGQTYIYYCPGASATSDTFGNGKMYISNYRDTTSRIISSDGVTENNSINARREIVASVFAASAAISSITIGAGGGSFIAGSTVSLYGITKGSGGATVS